MPSIAGSIADTKERDHLAVSFNEKQQLQDILWASVTRGINFNQINILFIWKDEYKLCKEFLSKEGINVDRLVNSQDIIIAFGDELYADYIANPSVNIFSKKFDLLRELAEKNGKSGLNIVGTFAPRLLRQGNYTDSIKIERYANEIIPTFDFPITVLCAYESPIPADLETPIREYHNGGIQTIQDVLTYLLLGKVVGNIASEEKAELVGHKRDKILEILEGQTIPITILNVDIVKSSELVKNLSYEQVKEFYATFLERTSDLIHDYGGFVFKYVGDSVLGFFPRQIHGMSMAEKAVSCGLAVFDMLKHSLNPYLASKNIPAIECRVSADYAPTRVVRLGSGANSSIDLFGKALNSAAKILHLAKPGEMVIGDDLFWRLVEIGINIFEFRLVNRWDPLGKKVYPVYAIERRQRSF